MGKFEELTREELIELYFMLGRSLVRAPLIAERAAHKHWRNTYRDYVRHDERTPKPVRLSHEFLLDVTKMNTQELIAKWYEASMWDRAIEKGRY